MRVRIPQAELQTSFSFSLDQFLHSFTLWRARPRYNFRRYAVSFWIPHDHVWAVHSVHHVENLDFCWTSARSGINSVPIVNWKLIRVLEHLKKAAEVSSQRDDSVRAGTRNVKGSRSTCDFSGDELQTTNTIFRSVTGISITFQPSCLSIWIFVFTQIIKPIERTIPDPLRQIITLNDKYNTYVENVVRETIQKGPCTTTLLTAPCLSLSGDWGTGASVMASFSHSRAAAHSARPSPATLEEERRTARSPLCWSSFHLSLKPGEFLNVLKLDWTKERRKSNTSFTLTETQCSG